MQDDKDKSELDNTGSFRETDDEFWKRGLDVVQSSMNRLRRQGQVAPEGVVVVSGDFPGGDVSREGFRDLCNAMICTTPNGVHVFDMGEIRPKGEPLFVAMDFDAAEARVMASLMSDGLDRPVVLVHDEGRVAENNFHEGQILNYQPDMFIAGRRLGHAMHRTSMLTVELSSAMLELQPCVESAEFGKLELTNTYGPVPVGGYTSSGDTYTSYRFRDTKKYDDKVRLRKKLAKKSKQRNRK